MWNDSITYRDILKQEFAERSLKNPSFSMRSYAKYLGLSPSRLRDVLTGRYGLSTKAAREVSKKLGHTELEEMVFCDLVQREHARNLLQRELAQKRLEQYLLDHKMREMEVDSFELIKNWPYLAILELLEISPYNELEIGRKLGLNTLVTKECLQRLKRLQLVEEISEGRLKSRAQDLRVLPKVASKAVQDFHVQVLEKAKQEIYKQDLDQREYSTSFMAINGDELPNFKKDLIEFKKKMFKKYGQNKKKNQLYCLSFQLFSIINNDNGDRK